MLPAAFPVFQMKYAEASGEPEESQAQIYLLARFFRFPRVLARHYEIGFRSC
jgi:hypothetical protein